VQAQGGRDLKVKCFTIHGIQIILFLGRCLFAIGLVQDEILKKAYPCETTG
jgi:uncharacterized membrane protein YecN with MAPEG domain